MLTKDDQLRESLPTDAELDDIWQTLQAEFGEEDIAAWRTFDEIRGEFDRERERRAARIATLKGNAAKGDDRSPHVVV